jgi:hypothetical protein
MIGTLAQSGGTLVGAIVNGLMRTWLADNDGQLTLVMWPGNFQARFDPLEIIDNHHRTVAHGGRSVLLAGGYLKSDDARALGHQRVFCAWQASEAENPAGTRKRPRSRRRPFRDTRGHLEVRYPGQEVLGDASRHVLRITLVAGPQDVPVPGDLVLNRGLGGR